MRSRPKRLWLTAALALFLTFAALTALSGMSSGVLIETVTVGSIPVTVFRRPDAPPAPVIVVAHGFAGSQQLMQPMAVTLARNGYTAVTFDFAGHGRNQERLAGGVADLQKSTRHLLAEIGEVVSFARTLSKPAPRVALVGHSMAADLVVQYAIENENIEATAALSLFGRDVTTTHPRNLVVIDGAWEPAMLTDAGFRIIASTAGPSATERTTYGDFTQGTARRLVLAQGAEHIGVLYSKDALRETVAWMNAAFGRDSAGFYDTRGKWIGLLVLGLLLLAWPASTLLPVVAPQKRGSGLRWRQLAPIAIAPAILTPLILWQAPTSFLPILLGDYLVVHFTVYGLLTALGTWLLSRGRTPHGGIGLSFRLAGLVAASAAAVAAFYILAIGIPIDLYVTSFMPTGVRWPLIAAMLCGTSIYFLADEWLTRGDGAAAGGYAFTKLCFLVSLILAVALNPQKLFFLVIIVPVICILFIVYGLVSRWVYRATGDPRVAALGTAIALAWAIAVTFPVVG